MGELSSIQLSEMAQLWREMARELTIWQAKHWDLLSTIQHYDLNAYQNSLLTRAQDLDEHTYLLLTEPTEHTLSVASQLVQRAKYTLQQTNEQAVALSPGALTVALAAGIYRNNTQTLELALTELKTLTLQVPS